MRMSATAASRAFSALLSRVAAGETVEIDRHGEVIARLVPARRTLLSGEALLDLMGRLPTPDAGFAGDVAVLGDALVRPADPWPS